MKTNNILLLFAVIIVVYFCAVGVDVMDADASQYAAMSREMKASGSYLKVFEQGKDYLDKPPFLFWVSSFSMTVFGENNFAFKLPSILFAILALFATYRFTKLFYDKTVAVLAALVLASCQAVFLITNDVRTDTILMSWVIVAIWQIAEWTQSKKIIHLLVGSAAIGFGMLTKGPISLFVPIFAFGSHFILQRNWGSLFKPAYLLSIVVIAVILVPMSIGLYQQFDLHPEKTVNGMKNVSGLKFFFWTQSFGRITGENVWNNHASFTFLFENLLWGLLPWTLFFVSGLINDFIQIIRRKFRLTSKEEFITTGGFVVTYCSLAISKYQLPHYIYVVLPLIAVITAKMLYILFWQQQLPLLKKIINPVQVLIITILLIAPLLILIYSFTPTSIWPWLMPAATIVTVIILLSKKAITKKIFSISIASIIGLNLLLSLWFYPNVLSYQSGSVVGRFIFEKNISSAHFYLYKEGDVGESIHFYSRQIIKKADSAQSLKQGTFLLTTDKGLNELKKINRTFEIQKQGVHYHVTLLTKVFLDKNARNLNGEKYYIVELK
ncbi:MAG: glycosyltransferase family 39 protein [Lacibacter sp.]